MKVNLHVALRALAAMADNLAALAGARMSTPEERRSWHLDIDPSMPENPGPNTLKVGVMLTCRYGQMSQRQVHLTIDHRGNAELFFFEGTRDGRRTLLHAQGVFAWQPEDDVRNILAPFCDGLLQFMHKGKLPNAGDKLERIDSKGFIYANFT